MARRVKDRQPVTVTVLGAVTNTELRDLAEPRVFDFVCLEDGERPQLEHLAGKRALDALMRTFVRDAGPGDRGAAESPRPLFQKGYSSRRGSPCRWIDRTTLHSLSCAFNLRSC